MNPAPEHSSLARILEAEVMDSPDEARDYDSMDHGEVNRRFASDLIAAMQFAGLAADVEMLDLGTGTAQIPIELCRQNPQARVLAIDLAAEMLALGRANVARAGLAAQISLKQVDAKKLPFADCQFSAVISNSIVHHIPEPRAALVDAVRVLGVGGLIYVRDLARPSDGERLQQLVATYAADCNDHQRKLFADSLHAALSVSEIRELVASLGFDPRDVQATSDRHWTWSGVKR